MSNAKPIAAIAQINHWIGVSLFMIAGAPCTPAGGLHSLSLRSGRVGHICRREGRSDTSFPVHAALYAWRIRATRFSASKNVSHTPRWLASVFFPTAVSR